MSDSQPVKYRFCADYVEKFVTGELSPRDFGPEGLAAITAWASARIYMFRPHGKQLEFLESPAHIRAIFAGNRWGKTLAGGVECVSYCLGFRPFAADPADPLYRSGIPESGPRNIRIVGENFVNHLNGVIVPLLRSLIPQHMLDGMQSRTRGAILRNRQVTDQMWIFPNGSTIELMSYEQSPAKFEGWSGDLVWFDEPPPRDIFIACQRGLIDRSGKTILTMTPIREPWVHDEIFARRDEKRIFCIQGETAENIGHGITAEGIRNFEAGLSLGEREARLKGKFSTMTGLVYKEFDEKIHVVPDSCFTAEFFGRCGHYAAIDIHGVRTPEAVMWLAADKTGTRWVYDELWRLGTVSEICESIHAKTAVHGIDPRRILIDPSALVESKRDGSTIQQDYARNGVRTTPASKDLARGIRRVKEELIGDIVARLRADDPATAEFFAHNANTNPPNRYLITSYEDALTGERMVQISRPRLYFGSNVRATLNELRQYMWSGSVEGQSAARRAPDRPIDRDDHFMENLYRLILDNPQWRDLEGDEKPDPDFHPETGGVETV